MLTLRLREGLRTLRREREAELIREALRLSRNEGFHVLEYSIQHNHMHLIAESRDR